MPEPTTELAAGLGAQVKTVLALGLIALAGWGVYVKFEGRNNNNSSHANSRQDSNASVSTNSASNSLGNRYTETGFDLAGTNWTVLLRNTSEDKLGTFHFEPNGRQNSKVRYLVLHFDPVAGDGGELKCSYAEDWINGKYDGGEGRIEFSGRIFGQSPMVPYIDGILTTYVKDTDQPSERAPEHGPTDLSIETWHSGLYQVTKYEIKAHLHS